MSKRITVIGAGPGGYTAAFDAAKKGASVTLIEAKWLGGTCLNCGCIPTKTLKSSAEAYETIHQAKEYGINVAGEATVDMPAVIARKEKVSSVLPRSTFPAFLSTTNTFFLPMMPSFSNMCLKALSL